LTAPLLGHASDRAKPQSAVFLQGVASGDPLQDRVILWTRVTPADINQVIEGRWVMAVDPSFKRIRAAGRFVTDITRDFTVKIDADGLEPGCSYYYRFEARGARSPIGRTRTLPIRRVDALRLAFVSCSNYPFGYFNTYARIAARHDLDLVLHLGDYIYEYKQGEYADQALVGLRKVVPANEIITLTDYRQRHALYKSDADLQEAHRQHPFICVWDDHESANDSSKDGAQNHNPEQGEGEWSVRKRAAIRAYNEYMPIRSRSLNDGRIFRRFRIGDLADLLMLDTRLFGRDFQAAFKTGILNLPVTDPVVADPNRTLLGFDQEQWLTENLYRSKARGATWRLLGQQVMMAQLSITQGETIINPDQWDGYAPARARLFKTLTDNNINNNVVMTGDLHSSWCNDLTANPWDSAAYNPTTGAGVLGAEFVCPAVSSPGPVPIPIIADILADQVKAVSPHMKYVNLFYRGYGVLDITRERVQGEMYHVARVDVPNNEEFLAAAYVSEAGNNVLQPVNVASATRQAADPAPVAKD
jgi:alkaline phosphatase D